MPEFPSAPLGSDDLSVDHFTVSSEDLLASPFRLDASFYNPAVARALHQLRQSGLDLRPLGEIVQSVFFPPRVRRTYVEEAHGVPFLQGTHVGHFDFAPSDLKFLSSTVQRKLSEFIIKEGWILVTRSGTVGRVALCPPEWDGWAASEHVLRIIPDDNLCPSGYLHAFLSSEIGRAQLTAHIYGAVVDEITVEQVESVLVPLPASNQQTELMRDIAMFTHDAMQLRSQAVAAHYAALDKMKQLLQTHE